MNADFLAVLEFWEREKGISRDVLVAAVEEALLSAAKKAVGPARELRVVIDQKNGDIKAFAKLMVSERVISKHDQISLFDARRIKPDAQVGEELEIEVTPTGFGRIASQYAKQALMQHIREAGFRTKLAVWTRDSKVDPVGACVGLRGQRVKNIVRELNNEKVDIIRWDPNVRNFITNALAPAKLKAFDIDQAHKRAKIIVSEDQLSLAIGKRGQNARLTSKLTGWQVDIEAEVVVTKGFEEKVAEAVELLAAIAGISREQADVLVHHGLTRLEDLLQADVSDLSGIPEIGDQAGAILEAARAEAGRRTLKVGEAPVSG